MPPTRLRARLAIPLAVAAALVTAACGSATLKPAASPSPNLAAAVTTLLAAPGFHVVYVDGDHSRTLVADVARSGDARGTLLIGTERFAFRTVGARVFLHATPTGPWAELAGADAAPYREIPRLLARLPDCLSVNDAGPVDAGTATLDGQGVRLLTYPQDGIETDLSTRPPAHLVRFVEHRPGTAPPPGCPGADITADVSDLGTVPSVPLPDGMR